MVDINNYLKSTQGNWLRAENCQTGDKLEVLGPGEIDDKTFDKAYLNIPVKLLRTKEQYTFRMGTRNVSRVADTLGKNTKDWVGKQIEVVSIETYQGLGQKGLIVKGVKDATPPATLHAETLDALRKSKDIMEMGVGLTESDWSILPAGVRAELLKMGLAEKRDDFYFITEKAKQFV